MVYSTYSNKGDALVMRMSDLIVKKRDGGTLTTGMLYDDILRYDPEKDRWTRIGHLPDGGRENMTGWVIDGYLYIGLGNDRNNHPCAELYRIAL